MYVSLPALKRCVQLFISLARPFYSWLLLLFLSPNSSLSTNSCYIHIDNGNLNGSMSQAPMLFNAYIHSLLSFDCSLCRRSLDCGPLKFTHSLTDRGTTDGVRMVVCAIFSFAIFSWFLNEFKHRKQNRNRQKHTHTQRGFHLASSFFGLPFFEAYWCNSFDVSLYECVRRAIWRII